MTEQEKRCTCTCSYHINQPSLEQEFSKLKRSQDTKLSPSISLTTTITNKNKAL